jgi:hypothetical protein
LNVASECASCDACIRRCGVEATCLDAASTEDGVKVCLANAKNDTCLQGLRR